VVEDRGLYAFQRVTCDSPASFAPISLEMGVVGGRTNKGEIMTTNKVTLDSIGKARNPQEIANRIRIWAISMLPEMINADGHIVASETLAGWEVTARIIEKSDEKNACRIAKEKGFI